MSMRAWAGTVAAALVGTLAIGVTPAAAQDEDRVLIYTGTTGYRHAGAIDQGRQIVHGALQEAGYTVDWEDCTDNGGAAGNCDHPDKNPRIFTEQNLARYDALLFFNASSSWAGGDKPGPLWNEAQRAAIIGYVQQGGGIAANHNATDMGAGVVSWDWWDGGEHSVVGSLMKGHAASSQANVADVQVADHNHPATRELPDVYEFGDEHYNFARSVRGTHHVLTTLDERSYEPGGNAMGQDHPITWCKRYDGAAVTDGTGVAKPYDDGRTWVTGMGHFGESYTANGGDNELVDQLVGGVRWAAGEGKNSDCSGTVWSSFQRTILVDDVVGPMGLDIAPDGKVFWTEIGPRRSLSSEGFLKMHDPEGEANNKTTVIAIPTRADHGNSEDGVLGMSLEPDFDLADPGKRDVYIYYSPRDEAWPTSGNETVVGYNQVSRFTMNAHGTSIDPDSERVVLRVPKAKITGNPAGFPGGPTNNGPGHVGGAGLDFDSEGDLYLGVGDDVSPNAAGHGRYTPMDYRAAERWDARKTSANSADLRGKVLRVTPVEDIPAGTDPGAGATYTIPAGNMFATGTAGTRPEIYAMGFRQPFTVQADPANPGKVMVGEYCHDNNVNGEQRAPAGVCEWNEVDEPGFHGWPFCMGDNSAANSSWRWNYAGTGSPTGKQYDCSQAELPSDIRWAPEGQTAAAPSFDGLDTLPGPAKPATIWKKYADAPGGQDPLDFGDLSRGGMQPVTGPVYRYDQETAGPGAFPAYYDGAWLIANRGGEPGFWKEVRLRQDDAEMLRVNDWVPDGAFGAPQQSFVIPSRFGPDGALYMARWNFGCCRNELGDDRLESQLIKVEFAVQDECETDERAPTATHRLTGDEHPDRAGTYVGDAVMTIAAGDTGCAGIDAVEYRTGDGDWEAYDGPVGFEEPGNYTVEYRATDAKGNVSAVGELTFSVEDFEDGEAPAVTGEVEGDPDGNGHHPAPATVTIEAADAVSPITSIEHRVGQDADWVKTSFDGDEQERTATVELEEAGFELVEFRATDDAGNTSEAASVEVSVAGAPDVEAPATTGTIPVPPAGGAYPEAVDITTSADDDSGVDRTEFRLDGGAWLEVFNDAAAAPFPATFAVFELGEHTVEYRSRDAAGNVEPIQSFTFRIGEGGGPGEGTDVVAGGAVWNPDSLSVPAGETVNWHFPPESGQPHDVWLAPPGRSQNPAGGDLFQVTNGVVPPGGPPVSYTFQDEGAWTFICRLHSSYDAGADRWGGMVGTVTVGEGGPGPDPDPPGPPNPSPPPGGQPPPGGGPGPVPPAPDPPTRARLNRLPKTTLASFLRRGLKVTTRCEAGQRGTVRIALSRREARKLGLRRATTLAQRTVRCRSSDRVTLRLSSSRRLERVLRRARGSVKVTVGVRVGSGRDATTHSRKLILRRG